MTQTAHKLSKTQNENARRHFLPDLERMRERARQDLERGAVTQDGESDREAILVALNNALATELVCALRYRRHHFIASGLHADPVAREFLEHSNKELEHADRLAMRIVQLGGEPVLAPDRLMEHSHADFHTGGGLREMIEQNLIAERIAIQTYRELARFIGDSDPTTRRLIEDLLENEEEHADELAAFLASDSQTRGL